MLPLGPVNLNSLGNRSSAEIDKYAYMIQFYDKTYKTVIRRKHRYPADAATAVERRCAHVGHHQDLKHALLRYDW